MTKKTHRFYSNYSLILINSLIIHPQVLSAYSRGPQYQIDNNEIINNDYLDHEARLYSKAMPLGRCVSGSDCNNKTQCSVMGMQRFSEPRCDSLGGLGSPCRMYSEPEDKELNFPHITLQCESVYMQFCPCGENLICHESQCLTPSMVDELKRKEKRNKAKQAIASGARWARFY